MERKNVLTQRRDEKVWKKSLLMTLTEGEKDDAKVKNDFTRRTEV